MKAKIYVGMLALMLFSLSCESSRAVGDSQNLRNLKDYSQYNNMIEVMQHIGRLRVMNGKVFMQGYNSVNASNREPLFVVDGVVVGSSLADVDRLITPVQVESVRTVRGMEATSRYGEQGKFGVVLIKTTNNN